MSGAVVVPDKSIDSRIKLDVERLVAHLHVQVRDWGPWRVRLDDFSPHVNDRGTDSVQQGLQHLDLLWLPLIPEAHQMRPSILYRVSSYRVKRSAWWF
jgi:hypothetical protein